MTRTVPTATWAWAREAGQRVYIALLSAANGAWDDVWKDIRRGQITPDQARLIVDQLAADGLLIPFQVDCYRAKIDTIEAVGVSEGCQPRNLTTPYFAR